MREQLEHRIEATWPRPFLLRPPDLLLFVTKSRERGAKEVSLDILEKSEKQLLFGLLVKFVEAEWAYYRVGGRCRDEVDEKWKGELRRERSNSLIVEYRAALNALVCSYTTLQPIPATSVLPSLAEPC